MVPEKIIHHCIQSLLGRDATVPPAEENVNSLCLLFNIVGKKLQGNPNSRSLIDSYLAQMEQLSNNQHFTSQMRFMVRGVLKIHAKQKRALRRGTTSVRNGRGVVGARNSFGIGLPGGLMPGMPGMPMVRKMPAMGSDGLKGLPRNGRLLPQGNGGIFYGKPRALPTDKSVKGNSDDSQSYDHMECD